MTVHYLSRADWDSSNLPRLGYVVNPRQFLGLAVHHTVTYFDPDDYDPAGEIAAVKSHMRRLQNERPDLGRDVPYSWVVFQHQDDSDCYVAEGRGPGRTGAHTYGFNSSRYGVSVVGNYQDAFPTQGIIDGINYVGFNYCPWATVTTLGHRDFPENATACPGNHLEDKLDALQPPFTSNVPINPKPDPTQQEEDDMARQLYSDPKQGGDGTVYVVTPDLKAYPLNSDATRVALEATGMLRPAGDETPGNAYRVHPATIALFDIQDVLELID